MGRKKVVESVEESSSSSDSEDLNDLNDSTGRAPNKLNFLVDRAPTGKAACKYCGKSISKGSLRFKLGKFCHLKCYYVRSFLPEIVIIKDNTNINTKIKINYVYF